MVIFMSKFVFDLKKEKMEYPFLESFKIVFITKLIFDFKKYICNKN